MLALGESRFLLISSLIHILLIQKVYCRDLYTVSAGGPPSPEERRALISTNKPRFTSRPSTYREKVRESVTLKCQVENLGDSSVIWKQSNRIISAGSNIIRKDPRLSLHGGFNLRIDNLMESDAGEYVCQIETYGSPLDQTSRLEILVPPSVSPQPSDGKFVVRKGSTITMECAASGNPSPKVTWQRQNNMLPSGEKTLAGNSITIQDVTRHHSGIYMCTANNNVGSPASAEIDLKVLYPPEIEIEMDWIKNGDRIDAKVSCVVHAEPRPEVKWYKDTMLLDPTNLRRMENFGNKHSLYLKDVQVTDFGNYSCTADNSLGREREYMDVSGRPHAAKIVSPRLSYFKDQYNLTWTVDSFLPIEEYRILYRVFTPNFGHASPYGQYESPHEPHLRQQQQQHHDSDWTNIIPTISDATQPPRATYSNSFTYTGHFVFYGLAPSTQYEVIIQSRNLDGWSDPNDIFKFSTRSRDYNPMELASHDQQGYASGAPGRHQYASEFVLLVAAALAVLR